MACFGWGTSRPGLTGLETTTSTFTTEAVRRKHVYVIRGYQSLLSRLRADEFVSSATFEAGGYDWAIRYYPHGSKNSAQGYVSVFLEVTTPGARARASFHLSLVPWSSTGARTLALKANQRQFRPVCDGGSMWGAPLFVKRKNLEAPQYLCDDSIKIECTITVLKQTTTTSRTQPVVPPSELPCDLAKLLDSEEEGAPPADVLILVGAESFAAHSLVLWIRCRKLYDQITASSCVTISDSDVQPAIFRALLHYIYTESLPDMDDLDAGQKAEKLRGLLVAADRYGMKRLKLVCEKTLCSSLDARTVVPTLAVAELLHFTTLRSACIKFIASSAGQIE